MIINTGFRILMSRWRKEEDFAKERMKICNVCEFNTKNMQKIRFKQKVVNFFSNALTLITTGKLNESDDSCNICGCTLIFKVLEEGTSCPAEPSKWKSIYIPNNEKRIN